MQNITDDKIPILIVDDSRTVRVSLSRILESKFSIIEAVDGEDGWKKLQTNDRIKLVITDIMMPVLDGYGLICRIRGADSDRLKSTPIIVVTSAEDQLSRERAHACGANNFIVKPAKPSDLMERVNFHTEAHLAGRSVTAPDMSEFGDFIENTVIESPSVETALEMLQDRNTGPLAPYAVELALKVFPLLEYCNKNFNLDMESEIEILKDKFKAI